MKDLFWKLLAFLGFNGNTVTTELNGHTVHAGGALEGVLTIKCGRIPQKINRLCYSLTRSSRNRQISGISVVDITSLAPLNLQSGQTVQLPFTVHMPDAAFTGDESDSDRPKWVLEVETNIGHSNVKRGSFNLKVLPHAAIVALHRGITALGVISAPPERIDGSKVIRKFKPQGPLAIQISEITLIAAVADNQVLGTIAIERTKHKLTDHLGAIIGSNRSTVRVSLPLQSLISEDGRPNAEGGTATVRRLIESVVMLADNDSSVLLRPSSAENESETLLRPVYGPGQEPSEILLRPVE